MTPTKPWDPPTEPWVLSVPGSCLLGGQPAAFNGFGCSWLGFGVAVGMEGAVGAGWDGERALAGAPGGWW